MGTTSETISFRNMETADLKVVAELELEAFSDAWNENMLAEELNNPLTTYLVMECANEIVGYAGYWLVAGEAQITRVAVFKKHRGNGWGECLTEALLQKAWSMEAEAVTLEVRENNIVAQKAYLKNGFKAAGVRPNYYEDTHEGAVIMWVYR